MVQCHFQFQIRLLLVQISDLTTLVSSDCILKNIIAKSDWLIMIKQQDQNNNLDALGETEFLTMYVLHNLKCVNIILDIVGLASAHQHSVNSFCYHS